MGEDFVSMFHLETKRLLWLIGITFSVILAFQYLELPYGNAFLSLFSSDKLPTSENAISQTTYTNKTIVNNVTIFDRENSTDELAIESANATKDTVPNPTTGFVLEPEWPQNKSQGFHDSATNVRPNITTAVLSNDDNMLQSQKDNVTNSIKKENFRPSPPEAKVLVSPIPNIQSKSSSITNVPKEKQEFHTPISEVTTVSEMNKLLIQSHASYRSMVCDI